MRVADKVSGNTCGNVAKISFLLRQIRARKLACPPHYVGDAHPRQLPAIARECRLLHRYVRYWHLADIAAVHTRMSAFGGKADIELTWPQCPLLTSCSASPAP